MSSVVSACFTCLNPEFHLQHKEERKGRGCLRRSYTEAAVFLLLRAVGTILRVLLSPFVSLWMQGSCPFSAVLTLRVLIAFITYVEHMHLWFWITWFPSMIEEHVTIFRGVPLHLLSRTHPRTRLAGVPGH